MERRDGKVRGCSIWHAWGIRVWLPREPNLQHHTTPSHTAPHHIIQHHTPHSTAPHTTHHTAQHNTSYTNTGSAAEGYTITAEFVEAMIAEFKAQKTIHKRFAFEIIKQVGGERPGAWEAGIGRVSGVG